MRLCLDFVNTEGTVRNDPPDRLDSLEAFGEWASGRGLGWPLLPPDDADAAAFLAGAGELREALYRIFASVGRGREPSTEDLACLNARLPKALERLRLAWGGEGGRWELVRVEGSVEESLELIALSAACLLRSDRVSRVKECDSETCSWMFIDESRNRSRRWCDMADCGNRAKARRFYRRHAGGDEAE